MFFFQTKKNNENSIYKKNFFFPKPVNYKCKKKFYLIFFSKKVNKIFQNKKINFVLKNNIFFLIFPKKKII